MPSQRRVICNTSVSCIRSWSALSGSKGQFGARVGVAATKKIVAPATVKMKWMGSID